MKINAEMMAKLLRFGLTGVFVTGVHYAVVMLMLGFTLRDFHWSGITSNQIPANVVAFIVANIVSFFINSRMVFRAAGTRTQFLKFVTVSLAGFFTTVSVSAVGERHGWHPSITVLILACFLAFVSFLGHHFWTFRSDKADD